MSWETGWFFGGIVAMMIFAISDYFNQVGLAVTLWAIFTAMVFWVGNWSYFKDSSNTTKARGEEDEN